jgi:curli biogenesis system outer membrane secretion channel CsgG
MTFVSFGRLLAAVATTSLMFVCAPSAYADEPAVVDNSQTSNQLRQLKRRPGTKPIVAIYEFRSSVPEIQVKAAQEMFVTALIKSGAFAVAERQRLNEGIMREKQLNSSGMTTGASANSKLAGANYVFEVVVSEANPGESSNQSTINVGGMDISLGSAKDSIGMDVRIIDTSSGVVIDAINVTKEIASGSTSVSGVGKALSSWLSWKGKSMPVNVDGDMKSTRKDSVDRALRSCMEAAVLELAKRIGED